MVISSIRTRSAGCSDFGRSGIVRCRDGECYLYLLEGEKTIICMTQPIRYQLMTYWLA